jgi:hypothetical protein
MDALKAQAAAAAAKNPAAIAAQEAAEKAAASDPKAAAVLGMAKAEAAKKSAGSGEEVTKKYVTGAITQPIPLIAHRFLTGIFPFAALQPIFSAIPGLGDIYQSIYAMCFSLFYVLGSNGANLIFTGSKLMGGAKFISNQMLGGVYMLIAHYFPGKWWLRPLKSILTYGNPWFTFDIVQTYSPNFARQGYKLPFLNKYLNSTIGENEAIKKANQDLLKEIDSDGNPSLTKDVENGKPIYVEGTKKPACLKPLTPAEIGFKVPATDETGSVKKDEEGNTEYVIDPNTKLPKISYGQTTGVLIGMVAVFALPFWYMNVSANIPPTLQATLTSWANWGMSTLGMVMAGTAAVGAAGIYALPGLLPQLQGLMSTTQAGGVQKGGKLPDMSKVIQEALDNTPDEIPLQQGGGGAIDTDESVMFLGSLVIASLVGITLAVMRNKKLSRGSV